MKNILIAVAAATLMVSNALATRSTANLETIDIKDLFYNVSEASTGFWVASVKDPDGRS